jgi:hypothetical protein
MQVFFMAFCRKCVGISIARRLGAKKKPEHASSVYLHDAHALLKIEFIKSKQRQKKPENGLFEKGKGIVPPVYSV